MLFEKLIPYEAACLVMEAYIAYHGKYKRITKRAQIRFERKDWHGIQEDSRDRITLYRDMVGETTEKLLSFLGNRAENRDVWLQTKVYYAIEVANFNTRNIAESFYNSVFRHAHHGELGKDDELMFVHARGTYREFKSTIPIFHTFYLTGSYELTVKHLLEYYPFDVPYEDQARDLAYIVRRLHEWAAVHAAPGFPVQLEVLKSVFFRNKSAYIVGRLVQHGAPTPLVMPIMHGENGLMVDALLLEQNDVSTIFSYTRSYFLVDVDIVSESVDFLRSIMPTKSLGELYNCIGFEKHGKTVFYREFERHLALSTDDFTFTEGIKGMVMTVFTLPSYPVVFKVIKDKFKPPKQVTYDEVVSRYTLVNAHNRVGRMSDSYFFQQLSLPLKRIAPELLEELRNDCPTRFEIEGDTLILKHCYIEKRMIPLDVYLQKATPFEAREAINEYGKAIKEMAAVNIFPGDMLLKNFGVTRLQRVVFYDYDEIGFLTDYNFRRIPAPKDPWDDLAAEPYYYVGPRDVFPEEFPRFLVANETHLEYLMELHPDLFDVEFWQRVQALHREGKIATVYPYRRRRAFRHLYGGEPREPYFVDNY
ncbi:MAG: bifunctional isocitrate dehydrogenase kinase/phosphatase [Bacteroidetes bacterium]|nr:MAG: bifunctional isocitrate dehydrogenase kinase/phosphatase [Bacteroidota bacterium]